jgi:hypothetical protein
VTYAQGDASDEATLLASIEGADVVVGALAPRGPLVGTFRDVYSTIARLAEAAGIPPFVVGGDSSLRPAPGADRFVTDLSHIPAELHDEIRAGASLVIEDLPATPETLDWVRTGRPEPRRQNAGYATVRPSAAGTISAVPEPVDESGEIDYDLALLLDAEDLAEQGILEAYQQLAPRLAEYGVAAGPVIENDDSQANHYSVDFDGLWYVVYGPGVAVRSGTAISHCRMSGPRAWPSRWNSSTPTARCGGSR